MTKTILYIYLLLANSCFGLIAYVHGFGGVIEKICYPLLAVVGMIAFSKTYKKAPQNKTALFFLFSLLLCAFSSYFFKGQSFYDSWLTLYPFISILFLYYILVNNHIPAKDVIKCLSNLATIYIIICIVQQITHIQLFGIRGESYGVEDTTEVRMGLMRYFVIGDRLCIIPMFYYLMRWNQKFKYKDLLHSLFFFVGIFMQLERMLLFSVILVFLVVLLSNLKSKRQYIVIFMSLVLFIAFAIPKNLNDDQNLIAKTVTQAEQNKSEKDIRISSATYYLTQYNNSIGSLMLGLGKPYPKSEYGYEIHQVENGLGFYRVDVGIFGDISIYGLIIVIILAYIIVKFLLQKKTTPAYLRYVFIFFLFSWPLNSSMDLTYRFVLWPVILYLLDLDRPGKGTMNIINNNCNLKK